MSETQRYEIEYIGGPFAGLMTHSGTNEFSEGQYAEVQAILDAQGNVILPTSTYRYKNRAFHWLDPARKPPPTKKCPTCGGKGYIEE
jgi:hypothetical protein